MVANTILIPCNLVISSNLAHFYVQINFTKKYSQVIFCRIYYLMGNIAICIKENSTKAILCSCGLRTCINCVQAIEPFIYNTLF